MSLCQAFNLKFAFVPGRCSVAPSGIRSRSGRHTDDNWFLCINQTLTLWIPIMAAVGSSDHLLQMGPCSWEAVAAISELTTHDPSGSGWYWMVELTNMILVHPPTTHPPPWKIGYNFVLSATGWMSGYKREKNKAAETTRNVIQPASEARACEVQEALKSALTVVDPGRSLALHTETWSPFIILMGKSDKRFT